MWCLPMPDMRHCIFCLLYCVGSVTQRFVLYLAWNWVIICDPEVRHQYFINIFHWLLRLDLTFFLPGPVKDVHKLWSNTFANMTTTISIQLCYVVLNCWLCHYWYWKIFGNTIFFYNLFLLAFLYTNVCWSLL